ncbi:MAG TPA: DUF4097 family beta strand repeat-containing protein, partial [Spirochaetota bacterium]|nr:DUF4097 family beta strand repeat-containing protein [Spirochaetota bacterium]
VSINNTTGDVFITDIKDIDTVNCQTGNVKIQNNETIKNVSVTSGNILGKIGTLKSDVSFTTVTGDIKLIVLHNNYKTIDHKTTTGKVYLDVNKDGMGEYIIKVETTTGNITVSYQ